MRILGILIVVFMAMGCDCDKYMIMKNAKVLSVHGVRTSDKPIEAILQEKLLSWTDVDVGIRFEICNHVFREEVELKSVEAASIDTSYIIPLSVKITDSDWCGCSYMVFLGRRQLIGTSIDSTLRKQIIPCMTLMTDESNLETPQQNKDDDVYGNKDEWGY